MLCVCVCVCACACMHVCMLVCTFVCVRMCMYVCMHDCGLYVCVCVCMCACMIYVCIHVCMFACLHVCTHPCMHLSMYLHCQHGHVRFKVNASSFFFCFFLLPAWSCASAPTPPTTLGTRPPPHLPFQLPTRSSPSTPRKGVVEGGRVCKGGTGGWGRNCNSQKCLK